MSKLRLTFGTPSHGWLPVSLETPGGEQREQVSDVGWLVFHDLVAALARLASGSKHEEVQWALEPGSWTWTFRARGSKVVFSAQHPSQGTVEVRLPRRELLREMRRSLEALGADPVWAEEGALEKVWSDPFPHAELTRLGATLPVDDRLFLQGLRLLGCLGLLLTMGGCVYGLVATLEPGDASTLLAFRLFFGGVFLLAVIFMRRLLASIRPRKTNA